MVDIVEDSKPLVIEERGKKYLDALSNVCGRSSIILEGGRAGTLTLLEMKKVAQDLENAAEVLRKMIGNVEKLDQIQAEEAKESND